MQSLARKIVTQNAPDILASGAFRLTEYTYGDSPCIEVRPLSRPDNRNQRFILLRIRIKFSVDIIIAPSVYHFSLTNQTLLSISTFLQHFL